MRMALSGITIFFILSALAPIVTAQTPHLQIYFDQQLRDTYANCPNSPPGTVLDTIYVVAHNFDAWLNAIEFKINYPPQLAWLGDWLDPSALHIGNSYEGIGVAWPIPFNAFVPNVVLQAMVLWMCDDCASPNMNQVICFDVYPGSGFLRAVRWPDLELIYGQSGTAVICPTCGSWRPCDQLPIPVEQTTWGGVKAMYR
ncbi:MAG: hypothetical protein KAJ37_10065 [Candidatus Krumholzibacteria bacterium]|nr:hypothetical protein [Candidatus Krumholzibacteria bacterium]